MVDVRLAGLRAEDAQAREARAVFDQLAATQTDVALVLGHAMAWIVAASTGWGAEELRVVQVCAVDRGDRKSLGEVAS